MLKQIFFLCSALLWTGIIVFLCLTESSNIPAVNIPNIDKLVHFCFYFGFTLLWFLFLKKQFKSKNNYKPLLVSFVFSVFFGITIEILQSEYTLTRSADMMDFLANSIGATSAIIAVLLFKRLISKIVN
ncbi:VanZ family protein [Flavobacterium sp. LS1R49]|uniref:VanZ family protein n=1 Tax=Flavobacterium shii TaxID=2987687 RepID=A0A9X2YVS4_9FLAO|nr:VanZ family protein [Flavobacterium shii]MCV9928534.1 VanZ family protein [Flavobacterium shii]